MWLPLSSSEKICPHIQLVKLFWQVLMGNKLQINWVCLACTAGAPVCFHTVPTSCKTWQYSKGEYINKEDRSVCCFSQFKNRLSKQGPGRVRHFLGLLFNNSFKLFALNATNVTQSFADLFQMFSNLYNFSGKAFKVWHGTNIFLPSWILLRKVLHNTYDVTNHV